MPLSRLFLEKFAEYQQSVPDSSLEQFADRCFSEIPKTKLASVITGKNKLDDISRYYESAEPFDKFYPTSIYKDLVETVHQKIDLLEILTSAVNNASFWATVVCVDAVVQERIYYDTDKRIIEIIKTCPTVINPQKDDLIVVMKENDGVVCRPISQTAFFKTLPATTTEDQSFTTNFIILETILTNGYKSKNDVLKLVKEAVRYRNSDYYTRTQDFRAARSYCYKAHKIDPYLAAPVYITQNNVYTQDELPDDYDLDDFSPLEHSRNIFILNGRCEDDSDAPSLSSDSE
jgi:hypothetical protein